MSGNAERHAGPWPEGHLWDGKKAMIARRGLTFLDRPRDCAQGAFEEIPNAELRMFKPFRHSFSGSPEIQRQQADWIWMHETSHLGLKGV